MTLKVKFVPSTDTDWPEYKHVRPEKVLLEVLLMQKIRQDQIENQTTQESWNSGPELGPVGLLIPISNLFVLS